MLLRALLLLALAGLVAGGAQGSDVDRAQKVADTVPRFKGPDNLDLDAVVNSGSPIDAEWGGPNNDENSFMDYLINLGILAGVGILLAVFALLWLLFRFLCGKCCSCWYCNCCCSHGADPTTATVALVIFMAVTFAFCVVGYKANSMADHAVTGSTGMTTILPGYMDVADDAIIIARENINYIADSLGAIIAELKGNYLPKIRDNVTTGTDTINEKVSFLGNLSTNYAEYSGDYKVYGCLICSQIESDLTALESQISSQTDTIVTDFQDMVSELDTQLLEAEVEINNTLAEVLVTVDDLRDSVLSLRSNITQHTDVVDKYEKIRKVCFIVLFLFPLVMVPFLLIGLARRKKGGTGMFTVAIYLAYIYIFCTMLVFAIHIPVATLMADTCVYADDYEGTTLKAKADECVAYGVGTTEYKAGNCEMFRYLDGCISGSGLLQVSNLSEDLTYQDIVFPEVPSITTSFSFSELDQLVDFVQVLTPQDLGFPQCFLDYQRNVFNGDSDPALDTPQPTLDEETRRALWLQDKLGYELVFPHATFISTHNSFNRDNSNTHLQVDTLIFNLSVIIDETTTNQNYTITSQLGTLGVRFIEIDAHYLEPSFGSAYGKHCNESAGTTDEELTRVCHANSAIATDIETSCTDPDFGWNLCETLCVCNYGSSTSCALGAPTLTTVLEEVNTWLDANSDEVIGIYVQNEMLGHDDVLETHLTTAFGAKIYTPAGPDDYTVAANWDTRDEMLGLGKQVVIFARPSDGSSCSTTGPASATLTSVFCQDLRDRTPHSSLDVNACDNATQPFLHYVTGTTAVQRIYFEGVTDSLTPATSALVSAGRITVDEIPDIYTCGYSPDLDLMDETLAAASLWSFASANPANLGVASYGYFDNSQGTKWQNTADDGTTTARRCACMETGDVLAWHVTAAAVTFATCTTQCPTEFAGTAFTTPRSTTENNNLKNAFATAGLPTEGVFLRMSFDASLVMTANNITRTWPDNAVSNPPFGEQTHGAAFDEADLEAATAGTYASPYDATVLTAQDLIADKAALQAELDDIVTTVDDIETIANDLIDIYNGIQDVVDQIEVETNDIFKAADNITDLFDSCANLDRQYFRMKDTMCGDLVEGVAGIAMASFFIGLFGIFVIFTLGALIKGAKTLEWEHDCNGADCKECGGNGAGTDWKTEWNDVRGPGY